MGLLAKLITHPRGFYFIIFFFFIVSLFFSFLYYSILPSLENKESLKFVHGNLYHKISLVDCIYFSVTSQATVGYGDIIPITDLSKLFVSIQVFFGYFYLCFSISIFTARSIIKSKKIATYLSYKTTMIE
jgi:voltage-gated potassium channel